MFCHIYGGMCLIIVYYGLYLMVLGRCIMGFYIPMCKKKATLVSDPFIVASDCFALLTVTIRFRLSILILICERLDSTHFLFTKTSFSTHYNKQDIGDIIRVSWNCGHFCDITVKVPKDKEKYRSSHGPSLTLPQDQDEWHKRTYIQGTLCIYIYTARTKKGHRGGLDNRNGEEGIQGMIGQHGANY